MAGSIQSIHLLEARINLAESIASIKGQEKYSDLTIRCGGRHWNAHRVVICLRSKFFDKACDGPFKESSTREITLMEDDPEAVDRMINWLYCLDYNDAPTHNGVRQSKGSLSINALVYAIADKYDIKGLKKTAIEKTEAALKLPLDFKNKDFLREFLHTLKVV